MELYNKQDSPSYIGLVKWLSDTDLTKIKYVIDGKINYLYLSNKATYNLYLGSYSYFYLEDNKNLEFKLLKFKESEFFNKYEIRSTTTEIIKYSLNKNLLYDDILINNGENTYLAIKRILNLALIYKESRKEELLNRIIYGLDFIINNYYTGKTNYTGNWWPYEIGIPRAMLETLFIIHKDINKSKLYEYLNVINFYSPNALYIFYRRNWPNQKYEEATYANLADNIYIGTLKAILASDKEYLNYLFKLIKKTLNITKAGDGFYPDGSFIQHKNIPYNASYGEVLLNSLAKILTIYQLLDYDITNYLNRITELIKLSYEPFLYNHLALNCVRGRASSRDKQDEAYSYNIIIKAIKEIYSLSKNKELEVLINNLENNNYSTLVKSFNYMDRYIYRNNDYLLAFSNNSSYIANYESINNENILGDYSSNGIYEIYYNNSEVKKVINNNHFMLMGSLNSDIKEDANTIYTDNLSAASSIDDLLNILFINNTYYKANISRFVLHNSFVCVGTNIKSKEDLHLVIYDNDVISIDNDKAYNDKVLIKNVNGAKLINYQEQRSYKDLNLNNSDTIYNISSKRLIIDNIKDYTYQIYPLFKGKFDDYNLVIDNDYHILKYLNYIFVNCFKNLKYNDMKVNGKCSILLKYVDDLIYLKINTGKRRITKIELEISGYNLIESDLKVENNIYYVPDELEHLLVMRKNNEKN